MNGLLRTLRAFPKILSLGRLDGLDFRSGLGDSAWLLYGLVRANKPNVCVEIGSARGRSAGFIGLALKANRRGKLYAIDPHTTTSWNDNEAGDTYRVMTKHLRILGVSDCVEIIREKSEVAVQGWQQPIDLLFIDGDHSYEGVKQDWTIFSPFVQGFGMVVFHDTLWDLKPDARWSRPDMGVPRFVEHLRQAGYPVITLDKDFGVSLVQPVRGGISLTRQTT